MSRVLLTLRYDATNCRDPELAGWLARSGADDAIFVEEPEIESMSRMCDRCLSSPSTPFCDGSCVKISYEQFQRDGFEALCDGCDRVMRGGEWVATCNRCDGAFCGVCVARVQASVF